MGCNILASWCITRFLCERGLFATPIYHGMRQMWRLMLHTHDTTHVTPNYKTIFFIEQGNDRHQYMLEPIPLFAILTIASMRLSSHAYFALNKLREFGYQSHIDIRMLSLSLPLIIFRHAFSTHLQPKPNPILNTNFSHNPQYMHYSESRYSLSHVSREI